MKPLSVNLSNLLASGLLEVHILRRIASTSWRMLQKSHTSLQVVQGTWVLFRERSPFNGTMSHCKEERNTRP